MNGVSATESRDAYHHGDLRRALLDASLALIDEGGVQNLSLRKAAKRAGVSSGAPYHHFENRGALMAAIAAEGFHRLDSELTRLEHPDPNRGLALCGEAYVRFARENPAYFRVMFRPELSESEVEVLHEAANPVFGGLVRRVMDAQAAGTIPAGDPEPYVLLCWSVAHGLAALLVDGPLCGRHFDRLSLPVEDMGAIVMAAFESALRGAAAQAARADRGSS